MDKLIEETYVKAIEVLRNNSTEKGIKAADVGYNQIWARDSFITFIGSNMIEDPVLLKAAKNTLLTLGRSKSKLGQILINYELDLKEPRSFHAGGADASLWYIIGLANLYDVTKDKGLLGEALDHAMAAYKWVRYQDTRNILLIDSQPAADWMDNTVERAEITLYNNVLMLAATKCINRLCDISGKHLEHNVKLEYDELKGQFDRMFNPTDEARKSGYWPHIGDSEKDIFTDPPKGKMRFYPQFIAFNRVDMHFDSFSNFMAVVFGISDREKSRDIIEYSNENNISKPYPVKTIHPIYKKGDKYFDYDYNKLKPARWRNDSYRYHNGGIWPFVGGFYVLSLKETNSDRFKEELFNLARANSLVGKTFYGEECTRGFNEWIDGKTGELGGQDGQSWSAGMFIAAYMAYKGKDPFAFLKN